MVFENLGVSLAAAFGLRQSPANSPVKAEFVSWYSSLGPRYALPSILIKLGPVYAQLSTSVTPYIVPTVTSRCLLSGHLGRSATMKNSTKAFNLAAAGNRNVRYAQRDQRDFLVLLQQRAARVSSSRKMVFSL
jgi:hypothetical protein